MNNKIKKTAVKIFDLLDEIWLYGEMADPNVHIDVKEEKYYTTLTKICNLIGATDTEKDMLHTACLKLER